MITEPASGTSLVSGRGAARAGADHLADLLVAHGFRHATAVPGWPATALQEALVVRGADVLDVGNERSAAEHAFGWSVAGRPSLLVIKGSGTWLAAEAIQNMASHGIGAPMLVVVGDDVDAASSTVPTDARLLGSVAATVVVDIVAGPAGDAAVLAAIEASRRSHRPSILRFSARLLEASFAGSGSSTVDPMTGGHTLGPGGHAHRLTKHSRYELATATWESEVLGWWPDPVVSLRAGDPRGRIGILVAGAAREAVLPGADPLVPVLGVELVHPFPAEAVARFAATLDRVLVVEDGPPVVEDQVQLTLARAGVAAQVVGQRTGHLRRLGMATPREVAQALEAGSAPPVLDAVHPVEHHQADTTAFDPVLRALKVVASDAPCTVHTCVGSCIAAAYPPHSMAATALELGASVAVASGAAAASGVAAVALIGDYGLIHSALEDHDLLYRYGWPVLTVVLADGRSAKTGGHPSACSSATPGARPLPLRDVLARVAGEDRVEVVDGDVTEEPALVTIIRAAMADLPRTIVVTSGDDVCLVGS